MLGAQDGTQVFHGILDAIIDHAVVVLGNLRHLAPGVQKAAGDLLLVLGAARAQSAL